MSVIKKNKVFKKYFKSLNKNVKMYLKILIFRTL